MSSAIARIKDAAADEVAQARLLAADYFSDVLWHLETHCTGHLDDGRRMRAANIVLGLRWIVALKATLCARVSLDFSSMLRREGLRGNAYCLNFPETVSRLRQ